MINMYLCKKFFQRYGRKDKSQPIKLKELTLIVGFMLFIIFGNQLYYFLTAPQNLYSVAGVTRIMTPQEISNRITEAKVEIMQEKIDIQARLFQAKQLDEIEKLLTHRARRLTYDSFGISMLEYTWSFMQPSFILSMVIQNSVFYLICLVMNLLNRDKREMQSAFKYQLIYIITIFIVETQLIVHTADRINRTTDVLDYVYPAFPIFERRHLLKSMIIPVTLLIEIFYKQLVLSDSEVQLNRLTGWAPVDMFIDIRSKLQSLDTSITNKHLNENVNAALDSEKLKAKNDDYKIKLDIFRQQREAVRKYLTLESGNITPDMRIERLRQEYLLQFG